MYFPTWEGLLGAWIQRVRVIQEAYLSLVHAGAHVAGMKTQCKRLQHDESTLKWYNGSTSTTPAERYVI